MDDDRAVNPMQSLSFAMQVFADRSNSEMEDIRAAMRATHPDYLLADTNSCGAKAVAEASGSP